MARGTVLQVRVSAEEKEQIQARAAAAGKPVSEFVRERALGEATVTLKVASTSREPAAPRERTPAPPPPLAPTGESEAEFLERRTIQIHNASGQTMLVARRMARAEWLARSGAGC